MQEALFVMGFLASAGLLAYHHMPLEILNAVIPKDEGGKCTHRDVAYGPHYRHKLDIYTPTEGEGPWPVVVFVHGGAWTYGSKNSYDFVGRAFASQGFLAVLPNYRLHPGDPFPSFVKDTARAITWVTRNIGKYNGKQDEIFLSGHSAGAYNVALAVLDRHYLEKFGTDMSVIKAVGLLATPADFQISHSIIAQQVFGDVPDFPVTQPVNFARKDVPPFLLIHGTEDHICRPRNSLSLHQELQATGADSTLKVYEGVSHVGILLALAKPWRNGTDSLKDLVNFFTSAR